MSTSIEGHLFVLHHYKRLALFRRILYPHSTSQTQTFQPDHRYPLTPTACLVCLGLCIRRSYLTLPPLSTKATMPGNCPASNPEFELIKHNHSTLVSTGCTRDFCQSGRVIHTDEPRIGENCPLAVVEREAEDFLRDLHREGFFADDEAFRVRLQHALYEIRASSAEGVIRDSRECGTVGGVWTQTPRELEFGLRRAWRNARKCIMRSHCEELK